MLKNFKKIDTKHTGLFAAGVLFGTAVMLLVLCTVFLLPVTRCHAEEMQYYTSGMYTYYVINEPEKEISICAISSTAKKIVIPSELDGYQVSRIGYPEGDHYEEAKKLGGDIAQCMEELVISDKKSAGAFLL